MPKPGEVPVRERDGGSQGDRDATVALSPATTPPDRSPVAPAAPAAPPQATSELGPPSTRARRLAGLGVVAVDAGALAAAMAVVGSWSAAAWAFTALAIAALALGGGYALHLRLSAVEEAPWLVRRLAVALLLTVPVLAAIPPAEPRRVLWQAAAGAGLIVAGRAVSYVVVRAARRRGRLLEPTLLVGSGDVGRQLAGFLDGSPAYGLRMVGVLDMDGDATAATTQLSELPALVDGLGVRRVIVAPSVSGSPAAVAALRATVQQGVQVHVVPRLSEVIPAEPGSHFDLVRAIPLYRLPRPVSSGPSWPAKRLMDVVLSILLLVALAPVLLAAAIGVKLTSPGPVLFRQRRVGLHGSRFDMLKFRTFPIDHVDDVFSLASADCPLAFGRFLRRTSIDELPQLWNVIKGQMSIIGPRPERPHFADPLSLSVPGYGDRHRVPGGITGASQVNGLWGNTSIDERIRFDNRYIDEWSLWGDLVILLRTIPAVVRKARS